MAGVLVDRAYRKRIPYTIDLALNRTVKRWTTLGYCRTTYGSHSRSVTLRDVFGESHQG